jgi:hypothetical protein
MGLPAGEPQPEVGGAMHQAGGNRSDHGELMFD